MLFVSLNATDCKTWLLACERSREALLVDPVLDFVPRYLDELERRKLVLTRILDTHTHADHVSGGTVLAEATGAPYAMHAETPVVTVKERLREGDRLGVGDHELEVLHTPGHTKDSLTLIGKELMTTGDFLFLGEGGAGRTDLLGGDPAEHFDSLQKLRSLPEHLVVLPGHDYRGRSTGILGQERRSNPRLGFESREAYVRWLSSQHLEPAGWMLDVLKGNAAGARSREGLRIPEGGACCEVGGGAQVLPGIESVSPAALAARLSEDASCAVLDVREPAEFLGPLGHVPGARNLSVRELPLRAAEIEDLKRTDLYVICLSGGRSVRAADCLKSLGFERIWNVTGGMRAWIAAGLPRVTSAAPETRR